MIIWGRTGCTTNKSGHWSCATGDCGSGEMECNGKNYTPPVTIAEIMNPRIKYDSYDVSLMNGFNLPLTVEPTGGPSVCAKTGCVSDLNQKCPDELKLKDGGGCQSACHVYPESPDYCCKDTFERVCNPTTYGTYFFSACSKAVMYEYNDYDNIYGCNHGGDYMVRFCPPADTFTALKIGRQLSTADRIVSESRDFWLGFFGYNYEYLGIVYMESTDVWVENPNSPLISSDHALTVDRFTGNLIITNGGTTVRRISNIEAGPNPNVTAILQNSGNLQLINEIDKRVLWQSFDYPSNALLPGMKLGFDLTNGQNWTITSCVSDIIPSYGDFTLSWETDRLIVRRRGIPYWTSGNLKDNQFTYISDLLGYNVTPVHNDKQQYLNYEKDDLITDAVWLLTPEGQLRTAYDDRLLGPEFCYGFSNMGCMEYSSLPDCRRENQSFSKKNGDFASSNLTGIEVDSNLSLSISDCFIKCWNNCRCVGFKSNNDNGTGCVYWSGINTFVVNPYGNSTNTIYVINSPNQINPRREKKKKEQNQTWIWILSGSVIPLVFLCVGLFWSRKMRNHRRQEEERRKTDEYFLEITASESFRDIHQLESNGGKGNDLLVFSFASIIVATDDFSFQNKLGQGGFGPVYKGKLNDGREIAIKRLSKTSGQGLVEFKNELILIARLQHTNLVRILGFCIHGVEKMLVYEYMPNKSLDFFLFDENKKVELDWPKRFNIIEGIAQGLLYLHKYSRMRVIHRDLKAGNILLDENMNPKISDFGMARIFKQDEIVARTNRVVGTYGYMSPEYAMGGAFSVKSDIFSFGVLILEIVSGRKNSSFGYLDDTLTLTGHAWELWQQGNALELKDPTLENTFNVQQFSRIVHIALLCVQESATDRPTTSNMISMLLNDASVLPTPNKPPFVTRRTNSRSTSDETKPKDCSINDVTVTLLDAR